MPIAKGGAACTSAPSANCDAPITGNGYERRAKHIPGNWFEAIDAFFRASILKEYFGKEFVDTFATLKEVEADRFFAEPTVRDFEWYLRTV